MVKPAALTDRVFAILVMIGDRLTPKSASAVLRTGPDFSDQGRALLASLVEEHQVPVTWLVAHTTNPAPPLDVECRILHMKSLAGVWAYWRARVVVHTHGIYRAFPGSRRKVFLNVWHGMPIKRLAAGSSVSRNQTDVSIATASVHAANLADTWGLAPAQVHLTGLPRNDVLLRALPPGHGRDFLSQAGGRPLVVWLPTFRSSAKRGIEGIETGSATQLEGADLEAVEAMFAGLDARCIVKLHPLAPRTHGAPLEHVSVWTEADLASAGLTLYQLLSIADCLITDFSSVWIDFLLTKRPLVFAISDAREYQESRGLYFDSLEDLVPGPIVSDIASLNAELSQLLAGRDDWRERRAKALAEHHLHSDGRSASRVADLVVAALAAPKVHRVGSGATWPRSTGSIT